LLRHQELNRAAEKRIRRQITLPPFPMKTNNPRDPDDNLSALLRSWSVDAPLPPRFRDDVWRRIARTEKSVQPLAASLRRWLESILPRPKIALSYVTTLLLIGMATGLWVAQVERSRLKATLGSRYVQSIDPYLAEGLKP
jgi:hypothetical protein